MLQRRWEGLQRYCSKGTQRKQRENWGILSLEIRICDCYGLYEVVQRLIKLYVQVPTCLRLLALCVWSLAEGLARPCCGSRTNTSLLHHLRPPAGSEWSHSSSCSRTAVLDALWSHPHQAPCKWAGGQSPSPKQPATLTAAWSEHWVTFPPPVPAAWYWSQGIERDQPHSALLAGRCARLFIFHST